MANNLVYYILCLSCIWKCFCFPGQ
jgi:hypothetical protein